VLGRDLSKNERIQRPWTLGVVTHLCANCTSFESISVLGSAGIRAIEWMPVLCTANSAMFFYILRDLQMQTVLTVLNSR
jgi:hypothetical protein